MNGHPSDHNLIDRIAVSDE